jgi:hypothetical protein
MTQVNGTGKQKSNSLVSEKCPVFVSSLDIDFLLATLQKYTQQKEKDASS